MATTRSTLLETSNKIAAHDVEGPLDMPNANEIVGKNLIKLRHEKGVSQSDIGRATQVSQKTVSNIERLGLSGSANLDTVESLARYFRVPIWQMMLEDMPTDPALRRRLDDAVRAILNLSQTSIAKVFDRIEELELLEKAGSSDQ